MSAGRVKYLQAGDKGPKSPAFQLEFQGGAPPRPDRGRARRSAPASGCSRPRRPKRRSSTSGPRRSGSAWSGSARSSRATRAACTRCCATSALLAGIGRAWANEILHVAQLSPFALSTQLAAEEVERLAAAIDSELSRGLELREQGAADKTVYRIHKHLGEPCPRCGAAIAQVDYDEHTVFYCPACQTGGRVPQGPPALAPAQVARQACGWTTAFSYANTTACTRSRSRSFIRIRAT